MRQGPHTTPAGSSDRGHAVNVYLRAPVYRRLAALKDELGRTWGETIEHLLDARERKKKAQAPALHRPAPEP